MRRIRQGRGADLISAGAAHGAIRIRPVNLPVNL
jgi:hypothetical protein